MPCASCVHGQTNLAAKIENLCQEVKLYPSEFSLTTVCPTHVKEVLK